MAGYFVKIFIVFKKKKKLLPNVNWISGSGSKTENTSKLQVNNCELFTTFFKKDYLKLAIGRK